MYLTDFRFDSAKTSWFSLGFQDMSDSIKRFSLVNHLATHDIKLRYRRTVLGPIWTLLNALTFVGILGLVYSFLFKLDLEQYLPFFGVGYFVWMTIFAIFMESSSSFVQAELIIKSIRVPYTSHILRCVLRNIFTFMHMLPIAIILSLIFGVTYVPLDFVLATLGLLLLMLNGTWVAIIFAVISTRFRDFQQIIATALQIIFFTTPIFWDPKALDGNALAAAVLRDFNPIFQQIQVIRAPLIGEAIGWGPYISLFGIGILGMIVSGIVLGWAMRRISIWL